jgi:hypothetical protein
MIAHCGRSVLMKSRDSKTRRVSHGWRRLTVRLFDRCALPSGLPDCFALPVVGNFTVSHSKIAEKRDSSCGPARVRGLVVP